MKCPFCEVNTANEHQRNCPNWTDRLRTEDFLTFPPINFESENARLRKENAELRGALQEFFETQKISAKTEEFYAKYNKAMERAERALGLRGGE